jgi:hypothetical protein
MAEPFVQVAVQRRADGSRGCEPENPEGIPSEQPSIVQNYPVNVEEQFAEIRSGSP